jgi:large subunit ribosomal protein L25
MSRILNATIRTVKGRHAAFRLRCDDLIPAVIYREGKIGTNLTIPLNEWQKTLASGERVVTLKMEGGDRQALIKAVQYEAMGDKTLHVDFNELKEGQKVRLAVSLVIKGVPKGHSKGGVLTQGLHALHVECLPTQIPDRIIIDSEPLDVDQALHVKEVKMPEGVSALDDADLVVISVHMPRGEEVAEEAPAELVVLTAKKEDGAVGDAAKAGDKKPEKKDAKK